MQPVGVRLAVGVANICASKAQEIEWTDLFGFATV